MEQDSSTTPDAARLFAGEAWLEPIEAGIRGQVRKAAEPFGSRHQSRKGDDARKRRQA